MVYRILHCIDSANPVGGGPIEGIRQLSRVNMSRGHHVELVCMDPPDAPYLKDLPFPVHAMGPHSTPYNYTPRLVPWLRANRHNYDVVIINGLWLYNSFGAWRALQGTTTPYFVFTHGMLDPWFKTTYPLKHLKKWLFWPWADYRVLRDAQCVLFTSEEERRVSRKSFWLYKCDELVVNYGTTVPPGDALLRKEAFLARFPHLADKRCILFLGRVHVKKAPDLLFRAFRSLLDSTPAEQTRDLHLVMAGPTDHAYGREMMSLAESLGLKDYVTWTGMVSGDIKWGAFHSADAFILPSHQENFGIAVAEALACGTPVLISNKVNIWREVRQDGAGLVECDDLDGTLRLLQGWLALSPERKLAMRVAAQSCYEHRFRIERAGDSFIDVFALNGIHPSTARR